MRTPRRVTAVVLLTILSRSALASTVFTNTRPEIAQMASLWEADSVQISSLVTNQYPAFGTNTWEYIVPHNSSAADGDLHIDMAIDSSGTGANGNNVGNSPVVAEIVNVTGAQVSDVGNLNNHSKTRGIFRFYTEHGGERHFELHPVTEIFTWNGSTFALHATYRTGITNVSDGANKVLSTYQALVDSSQGVSATVLADNNRVVFTYPSPGVNYIQYDGKVVAVLTNDFVSQYFTFLPTNSPAGAISSARVIRCRVVTNTLAATAAASLASNQTVAVNALVRTDMLGVSNAIANLTANQGTTFVRPIEFIALAVSSTALPTLPIISNVQATNVAETTATIQWTTDVASDSRVIYGTSPSAVTNLVSVAGNVTSHSVNLTGLVKSTVYYFNVSSTSAAGTSTDDNSEQHYSFITAGPFDLPLTPASGFTSTGVQGGPFTPASQIYSLSNTNAATSASWGVTKTSSWLDISPTNGLLAAGNSTNITLTVTGDANVQAAGNYSDVVVFRNLTSGSLTSRVARLIVYPPATLAVTPATGFNTAGPPGGPFSPSAQNYTVTNIGSNTLNWAVSTATSWLDLAPTSGTLSPGASQTVTVSVNTNANALAGGSYADAVAFTNMSNGLGTTTRAATISVSSFGFYDDFSTFSFGNLVGQQSWTQIGVTNTLPLQVTNSSVAIPGGQITPNQSAYKNITLTNITVFYGATVTVTSTPPGTTAPPYVTALFISNNATSFANYRLTANKADAANTNFVFVFRITGQGLDPYTGSTGPQYSLSFGTQHRVIVRADAGGTNAVVYVDPSNSDPTTQTPYLTHPIGSGASPPPSVGSFDIQQLERTQTASSCSPGVFIGKIVVADNFTTVYNNLLGALLPVATFTGIPTSGTEPLLVTFTDTSAGSVTNRFWNFGDGTTTNLMTNVVIHAYAAGTYSVTLVVTGPGGVGTNLQPNYITALTPFQSWLIQYFGNTNNPTGDPDGDGMSNQQEFLAGTNPTNGASAFRVVSVALESNDVRVTWTTAGGVTNVVQDASAPGGSYLDTSPNILIPGTGDAITNYLHLGGATNQPPRFYRIRLVP